MRLLIFLLALISAFFASADAPRLPDLTDLKSPNVAEEFCSSTVQIKGFGGAGCSAISAFDSNRLACEDLAEKSFKPDFGNNVNYYYECVFNTNAYAYKLHENYQIYSAVAGGYVQKEGSRYTVQFSPQPKAYTFTCPPEGYPAHVVPVYKTDEPTDLSIPPFDCAKVPSNFDNDCPAATENDPFTFSFRAGTHTVCYNVESGRQCEIETDENGGYYFPASFGAREPDECTGESDGEPTDPTEPTDPIDPTDPTDPDKTEEPEDKPTPEELDTEAKTEVIDGVNTTNINLDAINKNQISASNSNDERLNRIASEIQISNNYLSDIANGGSGSSGGNVDNQALAEIAANTKRTADNTEPLDFGISAGRKDKGLSTVFVNSKINELKEEIEEKNLEFESYLVQIQDESETLFTFDPNISADYEERLQVIKGVEVDLGVSRFSNFFKLIAPAILLAASITALFILLGGNKE